jgi:glutathione S-transferase
VPGLRHGEVALGESQAIIAYLDTIWVDTPMGPSGSAAEAAEIAQWIAIVATAVDQTLIRRYVVPYAFPKAPTVRQTVRRDAVLPNLRDIFTVLNARLNGRDYLAANHFTFADALLLATLNPALRWPEAAEILAAAMARGTRLGTPTTPRAENFGTGTHGFAASEDASVAVCVLPFGLPAQ